MTILPQLESELLSAHARRAARRRPCRDRIAPGAVATLLAVSVAIAVAGVAIVLTRHGHSGGGSGPSHPPPASPAPPLPTNPTRTQRQEESYLYRAAATGFRRCGGGPLAEVNRQPTTSQGAPSQALLSILGVLRRSAQSTDRLPTRVVGRDHQVIPNGSLPPAKDIYVRYIRRARWRFGAGYYIVPAGDVTQVGPTSAACYAAQRRALNQELPHIPKRLRAGTLALEPSFLASQRAFGAPRPGICLLALNSTGGGDVGCGDTVSDIEQGRSIGSGGPTGVGVVYGVVPDGVATVSLYYRGRYPGHPETVHAIGNVWIVPDPGQRFPNDGFPQKIVWRSANGTVLKTIKGP